MMRYSYIYIVRLWEEKTDRTFYFWRSNYPQEPLFTISVLLGGARLAGK